MKNKRWWWSWNERTFLLCYTFACHAHTEEEEEVKQCPLLLTVDDKKTKIKMVNVTEGINLLG